MAYFIRIVKGGAFLEKSARLYQLVTHVGYESSEAAAGAPAAFTVTELPEGRTPSFSVIAEPPTATSALLAAHHTLPSQGFNLIPIGLESNKSGVKPAAGVCGGAPLKLMFPMEQYTCWVEWPFPDFKQTMLELTLAEASHRKE